jgi:hypothetical protein
MDHNVIEEGLRTLYTRIDSMDRKVTHIQTVVYVIAAVVFGMAYRLS